VASLNPIASITLIYNEKKSLKTTSPLPPNVLSQYVPLDDQPSESLCRIGAADPDKRIEGGPPAQARSINAKSREAAAQRFEDGNRCSQSVASRFGDQGNTIADTGIENR
jgi:hypothetical protein